MKESSKGVIRAVALQYDGESAPVVTARGDGCVAGEIIRLARENDIPIQENPDLVGFLARVELGEEIPEALYVAVAEVIAFAYLIRNQRPDFMSRTSGND